MKTKITKKNVINYLIGNIRYWLYNSKFRFLIRKHIREQYEHRLLLMRKECFDNGACVKCGCITPNLQMAPKACDGYCYPKMISAKSWKNRFQRRGFYYNKYFKNDN